MSLFICLLFSNSKPLWIWWSISKWFHSAWGLQLIMWKAQTDWPYQLQSTEYPGNCWCLLAVSTPGNEIFREGRVEGPGEFGFCVSGTTRLVNLIMLVLVLWHLKHPSSVTLLRWLLELWNLEPSSVFRTKCFFNGLLSSVETCMFLAFDGEASRFSLIGPVWDLDSNKELHHWKLFN